MDGEDVHRAGCDKQPDPGDVALGHTWESATDGNGLAQFHLRAL